MYAVVLITTKNKQEANKIAKKLVEQKLIACANVIGGVSSLFWWQGKVDKAAEALMVLKTKQSLVPELIRTVKSLHSYTVPEVIALPIIEGNKDYLNWIKDSVK